SLCNTSLADSLDDRNRRGTFQNICHNSNTREGLVNLKKWSGTGLSVLLLCTTISANNNDTPTNVPAANPKVAGVVQPNILSPELTEAIVAQGAMRLENPSAFTGYYGYDNDVLAAPGFPRMLPQPGALPAPGMPV